MVKLNKIYTKTGDWAKPVLPMRAGWANPRPASKPLALWMKLNSAIGVARLDAEGDADAMLARIQNDLFDLGADLERCRTKKAMAKAFASCRSRWRDWNGKSTP